MNVYDGGLWLQLVVTWFEIPSDAGAAIFN